MENVQFEETQQLNAMPNTPKLTALARFIVKLHLAKTQKQAEQVMILVTVLCVLAAAYFFYKAVTLGLFS